MAGDGRSDAAVVDARADELSDAAGARQLPDTLAGGDDPLAEPTAVASSRRKRAIDIVLASTVLVVLSPLLAVVALAIRVTMGSPVFFRQLRPGYREAAFEMVKFRTMRDGFTADGSALEYRQRVTRLGWLLRALSLDEVPELWNVVRGDMSIVGPRPLLMEYVPLYSLRQHRRHLARPGITGLAQVNGRHHLPWSERFELDVAYVERWSLSLDLRIMLRTVPLLLRGSGAPPTRVDVLPFAGSDPAAVDHEA